MKTMQEWEVKFWYWVVKLLPAKIVYFCNCRALAIATTGAYANAEVPKLTAMEVLERYALHAWPPKAAESDKL